MSQVINTNIMSMNAQRNLSTSQDALAQSLERLSSGLRINSAKDDAAGLAISERMTTQIRGLNQAVRNANDGVSLAQTAESALGELTNNLQRIRELAVQAANASNSASDREALDQEVQQRLAEIDRIASQTAFNDQRVLDGSLGSSIFQIGANVGETISVDLNTSMRLADIGGIAEAEGGDLSGVISDATDATAGSYTTGDISALVGEDLSSAGTGGSFATAALTETDFSSNNVTFEIDGEVVDLDSNLTNADGVRGEIQNQLDGAFGTGVYTVAEDSAVITITNTLSAEAVVLDNVTGSGAHASQFTSGDGGTAGTVGTVTFDVDNETVTLDGTYADLQAMADAIQGQLDDNDYAVSVSGNGIEIANVETGSTSTAPVIDEFSGVGSALFDDGTAVNGEDAVAAQTLTLADGDFTVQVGSGEAIAITGEFDSAQALADEISTSVSGVVASVNDDGGLTLSASQDITLGGTAATGDLAFAETTSTASGNLENISVANVAGANDTLLRIDAALTETSSLRGTFGAIQNRFESTIANLSAVSENLSAARSRIMDADFASETAELTRAQILQQAGVSILSQANAQPQLALSLLQ